MAEVLKVKVGIIGDVGVGKTAVLLRLTDNRFVEKTPITITHGFRFHTMEVEGRRVQLELWDTAGQERYRSLTSGFFRGCSGMILMFDVTHNPSLTGLSQWVSEIDTHQIQRNNCLLVGNKSDLTKQVDDLSVAAVANRYGLPYIETSAKDGTNVTQAFVKLAKLIMDNSLPDALHRKADSIKIRSHSVDKKDKPKGGCAC